MKARTTRIEAFLTTINSNHATVSNDFMALNTLEVLRNFVLDVDFSDLKN